MLRLRAPISLVAVFVAIALIAVALIGGRLIQDWNTFHNASPAGHAPASQLARLEARPLLLPALHSLSDCSPGPISSHGFGGGPIYMLPGTASFTVWGNYVHELAYADTEIAGPVLLRGVDLVKGTRLVFVGANAVGPTVGSDRVDGKQVQQHTELLIDTSTTALDLGSYSGNRHAFDWPYIVGIPAAWSRAGGWQFDADGFTEDFVAC